MLTIFHLDMIIDSLKKYLIIKASKKIISTEKVQLKSFWELLQNDSSMFNIL